MNVGCTYPIEVSLAIGDLQFGKLCSLCREHGWCMRHVLLTGKEVLGKVSRCLFGGPLAANLGTSVSTTSSRKDTVTEKVYKKRDNEMSKPCTYRSHAAQFRLNVRSSFLRAFLLPE